MRIALVITPMTENNLRLAAQIGVTDIVGRYPGPRLEDLLVLQDRVDCHGLKLSVIEGYIPHDHIVHGRSGREQQIDAFSELIRHMGEAQVPILCYNFMPGDDWARTSTTARQRGGARVTAFDLSDVAPADGSIPSITAEELWANLESFLRAVVPVAEEAGVKLALHPDDPPLAHFRDDDQIVHSLEAFERVVRLVPSPANGICFCQGCFAESGADIPQTIRRLRQHIHYVHVRDVCGCLPKFQESFHDNGKTDMLEAMRAYHDIGFDGPMRPDHVPMLEGDEGSEDVSFVLPPADRINVDTFNGPNVVPSPGYTMAGRLFAVGYLRGLIEAAQA